MTMHSFSITEEFEIPDLRLVTQHYQHSEHRAKSVRLNFSFRDGPYGTRVEMTGRAQRMKKDGTDSGHSPQSVYNAWKWVTPEEFAAMELSIIQTAHLMVTPMYAELVEIGLAKAGAEHGMVLEDA